MLFKLKAANKTIARAATFKNFLCQTSPSLVAKYPNKKNSGLVPKTKAYKMAAPVIGLPLAIAKAIIAWVVPQGIKIVKAPKRAGAKTSLLLDWFLTSRVKNFGGWIIK